MTLLDDGTYVSDNEDEYAGMPALVEDDDYEEHPVEGECMVTLRALNAQVRVRAS